MGTSNSLHLLKGNTSSQELDEISAFDDDVRVPSLPGCGHRHATFDEVQSARETLDTQTTPSFNTILGRTGIIGVWSHMCLQRPGDVRPHLLQVLLPILWEQCRKGTLV